MYKAIIFDFAGVIGSNVYWSWVSKNVQDVETIRTKLKEALQKVESGKITESEFRKFLAENTGRKAEEIWPEIFRSISIDKDLLRIIDRLKK